MKINFSGKNYNATAYGVDETTMRIEMDQVREAALRGGNAEVVDKLHEIVETYTPDESARQAG